MGALVAAGGTTLINITMLDGSNRDASRGPQSLHPEMLGPWLFIDDVERRVEDALLAIAGHRLLYSFQLR